MDEESTARGWRDRAIAQLAGRQHGVVEYRQLLELGLERGAIHERVTSGRFHRVHSGVYLVGHTAESPYAREMAAVLACGPGALTSHRSAARLWSLSPNTVEGPVAITLTRRPRVRRPGIRTHRASRLEPRDRAIARGIPLTSPARTLFDLGGVLTRSDLERAVAEAEVRRLVRRDELVDQVGRNRGRRGVAALRELLSEDDVVFTRSEAEARMAKLLRSRGLEGFEVNAKVAGYEVDFVWRRESLVVEVDGYAFHSHRAAFERDRERDAVLQGAGFRTMRVTWRQLLRERRAVGDRILNALGHSLDRDDAHSSHA
jgi:very-short-patch-repair endonuclease